MTIKINVIATIYCNISYQEINYGISIRNSSNKRHVALIGDGMCTGTCHPIFLSRVARGYFLDGFRAPDQIKPNSKRRQNVVYSHGPRDF